MLFTRRNIVRSKDLNHVQIISDSGKMGIINLMDDSYILSLEYDNVFVYGEDVFIVHQKGKIGAIRIEDDKSYWIAECEYDTLDTFGHDLIFCNDKGVRYYNAFLKSVHDFIDITVDVPFLYCKDEGYQYILFGELGEIIYKKKYTSYSESCFCFCGYTDKGPVFYDASYSSYLYPKEKGYQPYHDLFNYPIIVNDNNIANITEGEQGIGLIDSCGNHILPNCYNSMKAELKITAVNENEKTEKTISIPQSIFEKWI